MAGKKKPTPIQLQSLDALFGTTSEEQAGIQQIALDNLHPFSNQMCIRDSLPGDDNRLTVGSGNTVYQIEYIT